MSTTTVLGRPADRANHIVSELRGEIVSGHLGPGHRLATRPEIERRFAASSVTVHRALQQLRSDGFIVVNGRQGTYVSPHPPHLTNYALAFSSNPACAEHWSRFMTALANEAIVLQQGQKFRIDTYYNVDGHADSDGFKKLEREVKAHRLAGIIFTSHPFMVDGTPLLDEGGICRVAIMANDVNATWPVVMPSQDSFWTKATRYLADAGRKRVAVLMPHQLNDLMSRPIENYIAEAGLSTEPEWLQTIHLAGPESARNVVRLLMSQRQRERPDALIISDDNLVEFATGGLVDAGVRAPEDIEVLAHCNFPGALPSVVPVKRLGYDVRQIVRACLDNIDCQRSAKEVSSVQLIPALFEQEVG